MPLINPKETKVNKFNPNVDNKSLKTNANSAGKFLTYLSFILIVPILLYIGKRNQLVRLQMKINESSSGIDIQLKKRRDTLVKLLDAVKGNMKFERDVQKEITALRQNKFKNTANQLDSTDKVASAINIQAENYPQLQSSKSVQELMSASADIELEIAASRRLYNSFVNNFNTNIFIWPGSVIATAMKLEKLPLFSASSEDKKDIKIKF